MGSKMFRKNYEEIIEEYKQLIDLCFPKDAHLAKGHLKDILDHSVIHEYGVKVKIVSYGKENTLEKDK